jgi:hypothetical protein
VPSRANTNQPNAKPLPCEPFPVGAQHVDRGPLGAAPHLAGAIHECGVFVLAVFRSVLRPRLGLSKFGERYVNRILRNVIAMERLAEARGATQELKASVPSTGDHELSLVNQRARRCSRLTVKRCDMLV